MTPRYARLWERIRAGRTIILDGGISAELERRGVAMRDGLWSALAAIDHWQALVDVHRNYIDAGADVITTNTYAASRVMLEPNGFGADVPDINRRTIEAALTARQQSGASDVAIAGSLSHMLPVFSDGTRPGSGKPATQEDMRAAFCELAAIHQAEGCDLLLLEMMCIPDRMQAMFAAIEASDLPVWCGLAAELGAHGKLFSARAGAELPFADSIAMAARCNFDVVGVMHTAPAAITSAIPLIRKAHAGPVMAYPDAGHFAMPHWHFSETYTPAAFADDCRKWIAAGVEIVGGCCGLGPEHIAAIVKSGLGHRGAQYRPVKVGS